MALTVLAGFEPGTDDIAFAANNTDPGAGSGRYPTTSDGGVAPTHARRWYKVTDISGGFDFLSEAVTAETYAWYCQRDVLIEGTIPVGYSAIYITWNMTSTTCRLNIIRGSSPSKYQMQLRYGTGGGTTLFTSASEFDTGTKYDFRIQWDGTNWTLWVNGTQEGQAARTAQINNRSMSSILTTSGSTVQHYFASGALSMSNSESDRPSSDDVEVRDLGVDTGGSESEAQWGDDGSCITGSTTAAIADVVLVSDQVTTATYWCEFAADTGAETVDTITYTFTSGHTIGGGRWNGVLSANVASKTVTMAARIYDGATGSNVTTANLGSTDWTSRQHYYPLAPGGGAWSQTEVDGLKIGAINQGAGANGANTRCAALIFTLAALGNDPPAAAGDRRRLLAG